MTLPGSTTTNMHTYFFREAAALEKARDHLADCARWSSSPPEVWSAGCSSGDEPYSLAILAGERNLSVRITATDVNPKALAALGRRRYGERSMRYVSDERRSRWFERDGKHYVVRQELGAVVRAQQHDVAQALPPHALNGGLGAGWNVILCRNVLIYLDLEAVGRAISGFANALAPGGLLLLGASEWLSSKLQRHAPRLRELELVDLGGVVGYRKRELDASLSATVAGPAGRVELPRSSRARSTAAAPPPRPGRPTSIAAEPSASPADDDSVESLRVAGDRLLDGGDLSGALEHFSRAAARDSLAADLHLRRGICLLRLGREREAQDSLRKSLFLESALWPAAILLGDLLTPDDPEAALRFFLQARAALQGDSVVETASSRTLAPFVAGRVAALEAVEARVADLGSAGAARGVARGSGVGA